MTELPTPTARITETPPGGWALFSAHLDAELFLFFALDTEMLWPLHAPLASLRASLPGYRRAFRVISPTLGQPWCPEIPEPAIYDAPLLHPRRALYGDGVVSGLALGLEEAPGESTSGVVHVYPLAQRALVLQRLVDLLPGGTAGASTARLIQTTARVSATGHALPTWAYTLDEASPTCLPREVPLEVQARIILNATPPRREPAWPRGAYYVEATAAALERLGVIDPVVDQMVAALSAARAG